jgi:hypothetical protein
MVARHVAAAQRANADLSPLAREVEAAQRALAAELAPPSPAAPPPQRDTPPPARETPQQRLARDLATAQRMMEAEEAAQAPAQQSDAARIAWAELGCPREAGLYRIEGGPETVKIRVKRIHIIVAEGDPAARFTVVTLRPPLGPIEYLLGHRVA